ncbi:MAG: adenylate/guanylate cyclase domain-containing protein [Betaproteobacteria bacterium]
MADVPIGSDSSTPMPSNSGVVTFLFTDIEGSTQLWERDAERMQAALARHDAIARDTVSRHHGTVVKTTGDGIHAAFDDPLDAVDAALQLQLTLGEQASATGLRLAVRCGIHAGVGERRDNDFYGRAINRAARVMSAAHGGQVLVSEAVATLVTDRLVAPVALRDLGMMRLRDLASAERLFQLTHPQLRADFPALRSLEGTPNNLPLQLTSFVGRERELGEVIARIPQCRLLMLTGPGGIGKTRLSLQAGADVMDAFPDGVYFVELAPVSDARMVPQAVASVLGVKEEAGHPVVEALTKYVNDRKLLLILDNCEHLVQACADLASALLRAGSGLHIVASSREALRIAGETTYSVPALSIPDAADCGAAAAVAEFESARLFVERAAAAQPAFRLTDDNSTGVAEICRRLDGIPLAIELAAACARTMTIARIAERLSDRFRLLSGGDRTALPRQQTLRALIDWSYDLLSEPERTLFRRLAVFAGGFTLDAVEAVAMGDEIDANVVLDLLGRLVEKALVAFDADKERYGLLETVRQYALDRLKEQEDESHARARHLAFYLDFAEKARVALVGAHQAQWFARLDAERENILSALSWCRDCEGGSALGLRLADAVKYYWVNRGLLELGLRVVLDALVRTEGGDTSVLRGRVLLAAGQFMSWLGRYGEAQRELEQSLAIARAADDLEMVAVVLQPLALAALGQGDREMARAHLEEALYLARQYADKRDLAAALNQAAQVDRIDGKTAIAGERYAEALAIAREIGDLAIVAVTLLNLAMLAVVDAAPERATLLLLEALVITEQMGDRLAGQSALDVCTGLAAMRGQFPMAARFHGMAEMQLQRSGMQRDPVDMDFLEPWVEDARRGDPKAFEAAVEAGRTLRYADCIAEATQWLSAS